MTFKKGVTPPGAKPFQPGQSGNPARRSKGLISLAQRIKAILEDGAELPSSVRATIQTVCGEDKAAVDALILVGLLQALQGDKQWADWLTHNGWGKPVETMKLQGDENAPIAHTFTLKIDNGYGRRYGLTAALGIATEDDDDGNAASAKASPAKVTPPKNVSDAQKLEIKELVDAKVINPITTAGQYGEYVLEQTGMKVEQGNYASIIERLKSL